MATNRLPLNTTIALADWLRREDRHLAAHGYDLAKAAEYATAQLATLITASNIRGLISPRNGDGAAVELKHWRPIKDRPKTGNNAANDDLLEALATAVIQLAETVYGNPATWPQALSDLTAVNFPPATGGNVANPEPAPLADSEV